MKRVKRIVPHALLFAAVSQAATASLIDNGGYTTDTISGLDWLDVTTTANMSYNYVSSQLVEGGEFEGWRYASGDDLAVFVENLTGVYIPEEKYQEKVIMPEDGPDSPIDRAVSLLGSTRDLFAQSLFGETWDSYYGYEEGAGFDSTQGLLSDFFNPYDSKGVYATGILGDHDEGEFMGEKYEDEVVINWAPIFAESASWEFGSFLIRESDNVDTGGGNGGGSQEVSEPGTIAILSLGIAGLGLSRRRSRSISR